MPATTAVKPHATYRLPPRLAACALALASMFATAMPSVARADRPLRIPPSPQPSHIEVARRVAGMVNDGALAGFVSKHGLGMINVLWEDTGRWEGSSVGPNISDVTIEVEAEAPHGPARIGVPGASKQGTRTERFLMPVMRAPNFTDKTADIKMDDIMIPVGNQRSGAPQTAVTLREFLRDPGAYMSMPAVGKIKGGSLFAAERDSHVLVSAQHTFLPVPKSGKATFYPVIFNYQSTKGAPAVLTLLVTRQGTSMTIIDNSRDQAGNSWGQRLYFNKEGEKAPFIAERLADVKGKGVTANGEAASSLGEDSNLLLLIQVPLKVPERRRQVAYDEGFAGVGNAADMVAPSAPSAMAKSESRMGAERPDVDTAVLGHGPTEGPFVELDGLTIERDTRFPVRVTVQFYQATSNGVLDQGIVDGMAAQISKVYANADYVGSLVVPDGRSKRPSSWQGAGDKPEVINFQDFPGLIQFFRRGIYTTKPGQEIQIAK
ncbi:MAG: hypothetical protein IPL79_13010 [Myxococcales bacterium]|nr:hypothetical protein [Myxococcales bacterium]